MHLPEPVGGHRELPSRSLFGDGGHSGDGRSRRTRPDGGQRAVAGSRQRHLGEPAGGGPGSPGARRPAVRPGRRRGRDRLAHAGRDVDRPGEFGQARHRDQARRRGVDPLHPVRAHPARADPAGGVQRPAHPGPPAEAVAGQRLHRDLALHPGQSVQLLGHHEGLQLALQLGLGVLEVAAAAALRPEMPAGRVDPARIGSQHPDGLAPAERALADFGDLDDHPLAGQRQPNEDHPPVVAGHAMSAVGDGPDVHLDFQTRSKIVG